jgi:hypothetical protein
MAGKRDGPIFYRELAPFYSAIDSCAASWRATTPRSPSSGGADRPYIAGRVIYGYDLAQHPSIAARCRRNGVIADKAVAAVDGDVRFVAERPDSDHRQWRSVGAAEDLAAVFNFQRVFLSFCAALLGSSS